jgi:serine/threonine protein kinase
MPSSTPFPSAPAGQLLAGRYLLDRRIGHGGMAEVWVATDEELDRRVAVKWLKSNLASDPVVAERFRREAIAVAGLSHPNIVAIHDVVEHDGRQAVVMQLVDGKSLRQLLDGQKRLGPELTIHIGGAIAGALGEAHRAGFVHRDVKPGNILVTSDGRVLLTDFGIAKGLQPGADDDLTSDNVMMGTAKYLSPEQVRGHKLDGRADIYSLGLVLYECLAGRVPFLGESDADTALARLQRDPTDLGHLRPTLPIGLVNLIHRTLARNPAHRPQTGAELRTALISVDTTPPAIDGTPAEPPPRIANPPTRARAAGPGIPGEPHITGGVPVTRPQRSAVRTTARTGSQGAPRSSASTPGTRVAGAEPFQRHDTPVAFEPIRGRPARRDQQRFAPALFVLGSLLAIAAVLALLLFIVLNRGDAATDLPADTVVPAPSGTVAVDPLQATADTPIDNAASTGPVTLTGARAFDPFGNNGSENDEQAINALADGSESTVWSTECYQNQWMGGKEGVGLIVDVSAPSAGTLSVDVLSAPYQLAVYATTAADAPADLAAWTAVGDTKFADAAGTVTVPVDIAATHLLVWLKELGPDAGCSSTNPYRGRLGEISFSS